MHSGRDTASSWLTCSVLGILGVEGGTCQPMPRFCCWYQPLHRGSKNRDGTSGSSSEGIKYGERFVTVQPNRLRLTRANETNLLHRDNGESSAPLVQKLHERTTKGEKKKKESTRHFVLPNFPMVLQHGKVTLVLPRLVIGRRASVSSFVRSEPHVASRAPSFPATVQSFLPVVSFLTVDGGPCRSAEPSPGFLTRTDVKRGGLSFLPPSLFPRSPSFVNVDVDVDVGIERRVVMETCSWVLVCIISSPSLLAAEHHRCIVSHRILGCQLLGAFCCCCLACLRLSVACAPRFLSITAREPTTTRASWQAKITFCCGAAVPEIS